MGQMFEQIREHKAMVATSGTLLAAGLLLGGCAAEKAPASEPNPSITTETPEPTPSTTPTPEITTSAGTFEEFKQRVESASDDATTTVSIANEDYTCDDLLRRGVEGAEDYLSCSTMTSSVDGAQNGNRIFNTVKDALPAATDKVLQRNSDLNPMIVSHLMLGVCNNIYNAGNTIEHRTIIGGMESSMKLAYYDSATSPSGVKPTSEDLEYLYKIARAEVCNVNNDINKEAATDLGADDPTDPTNTITTPPETPIETPANATIDWNVMINDMKYAKADQTNSETIESASYTCSDLMGELTDPSMAVPCNEDDLKAFDVAKKYYKVAATAADIAPLEGLATVFNIVRAADQEYMSDYTMLNLQYDVQMSSGSTELLTPEQIRAIGDAMGVSAQYPNLFM